MENDWKNYSICTRDELVATCYLQKLETNTTVITKGGYIEHVMNVKKFTSYDETLQRKKWYY